MPKEKIKDKNKEIKNQKIKEKEEKRKEKEVHICPNCGSVDLQGVWTLSPLVLSRYVAEHNKQFEGIASNEDCFLCKDCDFLNICPKVKIKDIGRFQEDLKIHKQESTSLKTRKKLTRFQIFFSKLLLVWFVVSVILIILKNESIAFAYFFIATPILFAILFVWVIYNIFKKRDS